MGQAEGMLLLRQSLILILLTLGGVVLSVVVGWSPAPWRAVEWMGEGEISVETARAREVLWVDARSAAEYAAGHVPGAVHLNEENWGTGVMELMLVWLEDPRMMVVYCAEAGCGSSKQLAMRLREAVTEAEIYWLKGGWEALQE
jgi:rhodanese-related sulfurtransferase